jgi:hypothetical protein
MVSCDWSQVLDAPALRDDFYLNLIDWSATNVLAGKAFRFSSRL